jgi:hypothetical protein
LALEKEFQNSKLTSVNVHPDVWTTELELLMKYLKMLKISIEDGDLVMLVIDNFPIEYDSLAGAFEEDMNKKLEDQVTVKRVYKRTEQDSKR